MREISSCCLSAIIQAPVLEMINLMESFDHAGVVGHGDYCGLIFPGDLF